MRIISGKHRGRVLLSFDGDRIRPTADRAKEAIFNIYKERIPNSRFLDLCSGSGGVGLEALSRGASVTLCDNSRESVALAKKNLALLKENCEVVLKDALEFLCTVKERFDFIFIDPPYSLEVGKKALAEIGKRRLLKDGGVVIYERDRAENDEYEGLKFISSRKYGKAVFNIYGVSDHEG